MRRTLRDRELKVYGAKLATFGKVAGIFVLLMLAALIATPASAQNLVTLTPSVTSGNGSLATKLTWSTSPAATSCTASGHASWSGTKAASGSQDLPPITMSGSYTLTLDCSWAGSTSATVTWVAPTTNTDGTALAKCASADSTGPCLAYFNVYRRFNNPDLSSGEVTPVRNPNALTHTFTGLGAGAQYFAVEVVNGNGVPSALSAVVSKTIVGAVTKSESVTVTVNPKPNAPTQVEVR